MFKRKAEMSILGALIAFALILLLCPAFEFYNLSKKASIAENNIKDALEDVCISDAIVKYNDVKCLSTNNYDVDTDKYETAIFNTLGYTKKGAHKWAKGDMEISNVSLVYNTGSRSFIVKYNLSVPFKILNKKIKTSTVKKKDIVAFEFIKVEQRPGATGPVINNLIPEGGTYTIASTGEIRIGNGINTFPETTEAGDIYVYGDYEYRYNYSYYFEDYEGASSWISNISGNISQIGNGWGVAVRDNNKSHYGEIPNYINYQPVNNLSFTFYKCKLMASSPQIPDTVVNLYHTFDSSGVKIAPHIPNSVRYMWCAFRECKSLKTASAIPAYVKQLGYCFIGCSSLTGNIEINTNSLETTEGGLSCCFYDTNLPITLTGGSLKLSEIAATANNGNVSVR